MWSNLLEENCVGADEPLIISFVNADIPLMTDLLILPGTQSPPIKVLHHPIQHPDKDETIQEHRNGLSSEDRPRGDLGIMSHLLIRDIIIGLSDEVRPIRLHDDLRLWVTGKDDSCEELEEDTSVESDVCCCGHDCRRD